jgi:hypothetical protein
MLLIRSRGRKGIHKPKENSTYKDRRMTAYFLGFAARVGKLKEKDGSW